MQTYQLSHTACFQFPHQLQRTLNGFTGCKDDVKPGILAASSLILDYISWYRNRGDNYPNQRHNSSETNWCVVLHPAHLPPVILQLPNELNLWQFI